MKIIKLIVRICIFMVSITLLSVYLQINPTTYQVKNNNENKNITIIMNPQYTYNQTVTNNIQDGNSAQIIFQMPKQSQK